MPPGQLDDNDLDMWTSDLLGGADFLPPPEPEPEPPAPKPEPVKRPPVENLKYQFPKNENRRGNPVPKSEWKNPGGRKPGNPGFKRSYLPEERDGLKRDFLDLYRSGMTTTDAADQLDVPHQTLLLWRRADPQFYHDWMQITLETRVHGDADVERKKADFLEHYGAHDNIGAACRYAGISRGYLNQLKRQDPDFKLDIEDAHEACVDNVEMSLHDKAMSGGKGSETAAAIYLNANRPDRYRRGAAAVTQEVEGGNVIFNFFLSAAPQVKQLPASSEKELVLDAETSE